MLPGVIKKKKKFFLKEKEKKQTFKPSWRTHSEVKCRGVTFETQVL